MRKKILIIGLTERMGGVETFIYNTTRFSNKKKYEYDFLVHGTDHTVFQNEINDFYGGKNHFYFIPSFKKKPLSAIKALFSFYRNNGNKYDFIHLETGATSEVVYAFPFCLVKHLKLISHSHNGGGYSPIVNYLFRPIINIVSSQKIACSQAAARWLFGKSNHIKIINNGIDTNRFSFDNNKRSVIRKKYKIDDNTLLIGHIGRFSEQKNHKFIIKIFKKVKEYNPNSKLMLLGVGELQNSIKKQVESFKLENDVIFCDLKSNTPDYYSAFDAFLMPSFYEGLPVVGIEAQSEGLPCFFSSNISKLIKITDNAHIISLNEDEEVWAQKILSTDLNSKDRSQYAKKVSEKGFSIESTVKELEKIYGVSNG